MILYNFVKESELDHIFENDHNDSKIKSYMPKQRKEKREIYRVCNICPLLSNTMQLTSCLPLESRNFLAYYTNRISD